MSVAVTVDDGDETPKQRRVREMMEDLDLSAEVGHCSRLVL
jgi:hypothetical protein